MSKSKKLSTAVIYGSARRGRHGIKAARFVVRKLEERDHDVTLVDSEDFDLPLLDRMYKEYETGQAPESMQKLADILEEADGYIVVSAEYNHSIPAALKNLLDHFQSEYLYKPSGIVTYSAGPFGGVRALVNLRAILAELGTPSIPSAFPISQIFKAFDDDGTALDTVYDERIVRFLDEFEWYSHALRQARNHQQCSADSPIQQQMCRGQIKKSL
ncbi:MAG: NAD(P)H-dependent oxidoreductase [Proteobacteria bacterium]|nr:NAD(P)H-dependent oxidoreductase [Pseudomonadota bacterium]